MFCFHNGQKIDQTQASVSAFDLGFTMGVSVTEQIRTYQRRTPLLDRHLDRLWGGLSIIGLSPPFTRGELTQQIDDLIEANGADIDTANELGIGICITPGLANAFGRTNQGPTTLVYTYELKTDAAATAAGIRLTSVNTTEIPDTCIPKALKCRSRIHYYLAEREATAIDPNSRAVLNDTEGFVAEGTTASVIIVDAGVIVAPLIETVLPGVTLGFALELAESMGTAVERREIRIDELHSADEILWLSTPVGIVPVTHVNGQTIGDAKAGPITRQLSSAWKTALSDSRS